MISTHRKHVAWILALGLLILLTVFIASRRDSPPGPDQNAQAGNTTINEQAPRPPRPVPGGGVKGIAGGGSDD